MPDDGSLATKRTPVAPWIATITIIGVALFFGFGTESINDVLDKLWGSDFRRAARILSRLWVYSTPPGALVGILLGYLFLRSSWLTRATIRFLRVGRWVPFLIWWVIAAELTAAPQQFLSRSWFWTYGAVTVALTACYEFLAARFVLRLPFRAGLKSVVRPAIIQGIFIALILDMSVWGELWIVYPGKTPIGYLVFITLVTTILLINWAFGHSFDHAAVNRATMLVEELKHDNWSSFLGASALVVTCLVLWQALTGPVFLSSPIEVPKELQKALLEEGYLLREIYLSLAKVLVGIALSGSIAAFLVFVMNRAGSMKSITDGLFQASQVAPIALLPDILGFFEIPEHKWSTMCVAVFCFYSFAKTFLGLRSEGILPRTLLALDEALPYGAAAIVYGEAMMATGGLGFMMVVAGATYQTAKGLTGFVTLVFLVATLSTLLRWVTKRAYCSLLTASKG